MKSLSFLALAAVGVLVAANWSDAQQGSQNQPRGERGDERGGGRDQGGRPGPPGPPPPDPFLELFDTNRDGEISKSEIDNAAAALRKLDANGDGKLTHRELPRPPRPPRGGPGGDDRLPPRGGPGGDDRPPRDDRGGHDRPRRPGGEG